MSNYCFGYCFDLSIECIKRGKIDYLAHYYKNLEPNPKYTLLETRIQPIAKFLIDNSEFNTADNIRKLHEIYGKEFFDKAMVSVLSNAIIRHRNIVKLDNLPPSLGNLPPRLERLFWLDSGSNLEINRIISLDPIPTQMTDYYPPPINITNATWDRVKDCPEFKAFKEYQSNYIQDSNVLNSLLMDNTDIHNIRGQHPQIFDEIRSSTIIH